MARAKFKIDSEKDSINFYGYMIKNKEIFYREMLFSEDNKSEEDIDKESAEFWKLYGEAIGNYKIYGDQEKGYEEQTKLLYMLPYSRIQKIKISLRAKRKNKYEKRKKQLTIDRSIHNELSMYAKSYNITLSEAIGKLLDKNRS